MNAETIGSIVYWRLAPTRAADVRHVLEQLNLADHMPEERKPITILRAAMREASPDRLVRPTADKQTAALVSEDKNASTAGDQWATLEGTASADDNGAIDLSNLPIEIREIVEGAYWIERELLSAAQLGSMLVAIVTSLNGRRLRPHGAVYWLPPEAQSTWSKLAAAMEGINSDCVVYSIVTSPDQGSIRAIVDGIVQHTMDDLRDIKSRVESGELKERGLQSQADQARRIMDRIGPWERTLGEALDQLREAAQKTEAEATRAAMLATGQMMFQLEECTV